MPKEKKATWWKMFAHQRAAIEAVSDKSAGAGLKAAFRYFDGEDIPAGSITPQAFTVFCVIRPYIDEAKQDFEKAVENGRKGAQNRWGNNGPPIGPLYPPHSPPIGCLREADISISPNGEIENIPPISPQGASGRRRFVPPTVEEVRTYCQERQNGIDPEEFVAFYASKGWKVGQAPMKDWRQAVVTWEKRRKNGGKGEFDDVV